MPCSIDISSMTSDMEETAESASEKEIPPSSAAFINSAPMNRGIAAGLIQSSVKFIPSGSPTCSAMPFGRIRA